MTITPNALDRLVGIVSPRAGLARLRARAASAALEAHLRRYDGAARSRRTSGWTAGPHSANAEIGPALHTLRNRTRELVRNNGWAARAVRHLTNASVGSVGMIPTPVGGTDAVQKAAMETWSGWSASTEVDPEGRLNFAGLQNLGAREAFESGEILLRRRWRRRADSLELPFQIQLLEPDHLDTGRTEQLKGGNLIIQGVEYNRIGARVGYWLFEQHPGDAVPIKGRSYVSKRIPARDIIHFFEPLRVGQVRGVPRGCPALIRHRDFDEYEDATLVRAKIAAMTVAFVTNDLEAENEPAPGFGNDEDFPVESMEPGSVDYLKPGQGVEFNNPPAPIGYEDYARVSLRAIGAAWGVSYESLTGDLSRTSFSSGRLGWISETLDLDVWRRLWLVPQVCDRVWGWYMEAAGLAGIVPTGTKLRAVWTPPRREMIQPGQEIRAMKDQIAGGLLSVSEALRKLGYDPKQVWAEMKADLEKLRELGVEPDLLVKLAEEKGDAPPTPDIPMGTSEGKSLAVNGAKVLGELVSDRT